MLLTDLKQNMQKLEGGGLILYEIIYLAAICMHFDWLLLMIYWRRDA